MSRSPATAAICPIPIATNRLQRVMLHAMKATFAELEHDSIVAQSHLGEHPSRGDGATRSN